MGAKPALLTKDRFQGGWASKINQRANDRLIYRALPTSVLKGNYRNTRSAWVRGRAFFKEAGQSAWGGGVSSLSGGILP